MKSKNPFKILTKFEYILWGVSLIVVTASFLLVPEKDYFTLMASLVGVSALIFVARGHVLGQALIIAFAVLYGLVSFFFGYYGEMITYLGMSAPMAVIAIVSWIRHPYKDSAEVEVHRVSRLQIVIVSLCSIAVTVAFFFILKALGTTNLIFSTISVLTSFVASCLTFLRSPFYALAYALNDVVLIVLWVLATVANNAYFPMIICFAMFLINDIYGFISWRRMQKRQGASKASPKQKQE